MPGTSGTRGPYDTARWKKLHQLIIARDPICKGPCGGANKSVTADHIRAVKDGGAFWDPNNLQGVCYPCHRLKSRQEQGQRGDLPGGPVRQRKALVPGCDPATGMPLDPAHPWHHESPQAPLPVGPDSGARSWNREKDSIMIASWRGSKWA